MSVNVGENGKRSVQVEIEVPGTPEEVWQAIATGQGISSWFVPTQVEEHVGGSVKTNYRQGLESVSSISEWNPPSSFKMESDGMAPGAPTFTSDWSVSPRSSGSCAVRVVHSWVASSNEWDGHWEGVQKGWYGFFNVLRLKLEHFRGQLSAAFDTAGFSIGSEQEVWEAVTSPLGLINATEGQEVRSELDVPLLSGKVEVADHGDEKHVMLVLDEPGPGLCHLFLIPMGKRIYVSLRFYLFGEGAANAVAKAEPEWNRWLAERFPLEGSSA